MSSFVPKNKYADMVKLVRKLHELGGVLSDWFVEDHSEEFPELTA
jgi:hypothetical protein